MQTRRGETPKTYFRSDRFYTVGANWYVATREGNDIGPFSSRAAAEASVAKYLGGVKSHKDSGVHARSLSRDAWANTNFI